MFKTYCFLLCLSISYCLIAQNKIELRDLSFTVPETFQYHKDYSEQVETNVFREVGIVYSDAQYSDALPKVQYQYFEMVGLTVKGSKNILDYLNGVMNKSMKSEPKSIIMKPEENYSLSLYEFNGKSLFEIKSLGKKGWVNIQYVAEPNQDVQSMRIMNSIIPSIIHNEKYVEKVNPFRKQLEKTKSESEPGRRSRWGLILVIISVVSLIVGKLIGKRNT